MAKTQCNKKQKKVNRTECAKQGKDASRGKAREAGGSGQKCIQKKGGEEERLQNLSTDSKLRGWLGVAKDWKRRKK